MVTINAVVCQKYGDGPASISLHAACPMQDADLAEGHIGVYDEVVLCCCGQLVGSQIRLWVQRGTAPDIITEVVLPAHL